MSAKSRSRTRRGPSAKLRATTAGRKVLSRTKTKKSTRKTPAPRKPKVKKKTAPRAFMPDDSLARAVGLAQKGKIKQAFRTAESILAAYPEHWRTLDFLSSLFKQTGQADGALAFAKRTIAHAPDDAKIRRRLTMNLAAIAMRFNRSEDAIPIFQEFLDRYEPSAQIIATLSTLEITAHRLLDALKTANEGIALFPDNATLHHNRAAAFFHLGRNEEAVEAFGLMLHPFVGDRDAIPAQVVSQYADMAEGYDSNPLHRLYGRMMAGMIVKTVGRTAGKRILDAGCGTGSLGMNLKAACLVGIDLSPEMLTQARGRNVYQELVEGDLVAAMAQRTDSFDIVASTVVLYHLADLGSFFREAARLLVSGGHLFFSVDPAPDSMEIGISTPGEYAHSRAYVRGLAAKTGFAEIAIRIMEHRGNPGFWCAFRRQ